MKKKLFQLVFNTFILLFIAIIPVYGQWTELNSGVSADLSDIFFINYTTGWVVGDEGIVLHTVDGGASWAIQDTPTDSALYRVVFTDEDHGYIISKQYSEDGWLTNVFPNEHNAGSSRLLLTTDGGNNWTVDNLGDSLQLLGIHFLNSDTGWISGRDSYNLIPILFKTVDAGNSWNKIYEGSVSGISYFNDVVFVDNENGWLFETKYDSEDNPTIIFRTFDGGLTWSEIGQTSGPAFTATLIDQDTMWAYGHNYSGISYDGGINWNQMDNFNSMFPLSGTAGWFVQGYDISYTDNSGISGQYLTLATVNSIFAFDKNLCWAVGRYGNIIKYYNDVTTSVISSTQTPLNFNLGQNYPNPFNPETKINYHLPFATHVTLTVYNILGQEVEKIVESELPAGYHSVKWDASKVSSGVYIYRITAGSFTYTKKMLVMK